MWRHVVLAAALAAWSVLAVKAAPIAITNASFENGVAVDVPDWVDGELGAQAAHNTTIASALASDGSNVAQLRGYHSGTATTGLRQLLGVNVAEGTYTIRFDAESANTSSTDIFAGLFHTAPSVANYLGGSITLLSAATPALESYSVAIVVPAGSLAIGLPLGLQFINAGTSSSGDALNPLSGDIDGNGGPTNLLLLDNIALDFAPPVPEPSTIALLGGVVLLIGRCHRWR